MNVVFREVVFKENVFLREASKDEVSDSTLDDYRVKLNGGSEYLIAICALPDEHAKSAHKERKFLNYPAQKDEYAAYRDIIWRLLFEHGLTVGKDTKKGTFGPPLQLDDSDPDVLEHLVAAKKTGIRLRKASPNKTATPAGADPRYSIVDDKPQYFFKMQNACFFAGTPARKALNLEGQFEAMLKAGKTPKEFLTLWLPADDLLEQIYKVAEPKQDGSSRDVLDTVKATPSAGGVGDSTLRAAVQIPYATFLPRSVQAQLYYFGEILRETESSRENTIPLVCIDTSTCTGKEGQLMVNNVTTDCTGQELNTKKCAGVEPMLEIGVRDTNRIPGSRHRCRAGCAAKVGYGDKIFTIDRVDYATAPSGPRTMQTLALFTQFLFLDQTREDLPTAAPVTLIAQ